MRGTEADALSASYAQGRRDERKEHAMRDSEKWDDYLKVGDRSDVDMRTALRIVADLSKAEAREAALREALEWYAIPGHYVSSSLYMGGGQGPTMADTDGGQRARAALAVKERSTP